jgi:outer membrane cobalamin receptor
MRTGAVSALLALACPSLCLAQFPAELEGTVSDAASGARIPSATVQLRGGAVAQTQADGTFQLRGLDPGTVTLRVVAIGYQPSELSLTLANGQHRTLAIRLVPAPIVLPELVSIANRPTPGVTVLDRDAIQASGRVDLGTLLEGQTGVLIERRGGAAGPATISIRGSSSGQVLVLLDGTPLNDALTGSADLSLVSLETLDSVVIRRGGGSERYGSRAMGGVVELYSRRSGRPAGLSLGARAGAWGDRGLSGTFSAAHPTGSGRLSAQATGSARNLDGDFEFDVPPARGGGTANRINAGSEQRAAQASAGYEWGHDEFRLRGDWLRVDRGMPGTDVQQTPFATQAQRRLGGGAGLRVRGSAVSWLTDVAVQHQRAEFQDSAPPTGAPYHDSLTALNVTAQSGIDLVRGAWSLSSGIDYRYLRAEGSALTTSAPESQTFGGLWGSVALHRPWGPDGFFQLSLAARGDAGTGIGDPVLSPKAAASAGRGAWSLTATWGSSFSPPALGDLFFQEGVQVRANPDLRPERVRDEITLSAGLREQPLLGALVRATLSAYRADIDDMILWSPDFRYIWSPHNFDVNRRGLEAELTTRFPAWNAELGVSGALNDLTYVGPVLTGQVIYRPRWTANGHFDISLIGVRTGLLVRYVGARRTGIGSELNQLPAFATVDLHLSHGFRLGSTRLEISGGVDNLLDERTSLLVDYPAPGRSWWLGTRLSLGQDGLASESN